MTEKSSPTTPDDAPTGQRGLDEAGVEAAAKAIVDALVDQAQASTTETEDEFNAWIPVAARAAITAYLATAPTRDPVGDGGLTWTNEWEYTDWLNSLMENAPEDFDADVAMEELVLRYINALEERVQVLTASLLAPPVGDGERAALRRALDHLDAALAALDAQEATT